MKISIHLGAHCTDEDQLIKSLLKNGDRLIKEGICVPGPGRYRNILSQVLGKLQGAQADKDTQEMLLDHILDHDDVEHLVIGHENFLGAQFRALEGGHLYPLAERNTAWLRALFPQHEVEFFLGMRDISTFVPALVASVKPEQRAGLMQTLNPHTLYWSDVIHSIRDANPDCRVTVWNNEETHLTWPEIMHEIAGLDPAVRLLGGLDILAKIMAREGMSRLRKYMSDHEIINEIQRRRILSAFLDKYAIDEEIEEEVSLRGWDEALLEELSGNYDDDMNEIKGIPGVTLITA